MKKILLFIVTCLFVASCSTKQRTKYQEIGTDKSGGFTESMYADGTYKARFAGNGYTSPKDAELFSVFRAIELCNNDGFAVAEIFGVYNLSKSKKIKKSSSYNYKMPTNINGQYSSTTDYSNYSNVKTKGQYDATVSGGHTMGGTRQWTETYNFPVFDTVVKCINSKKLIGVMTEELDRKEVKRIKDDFMGAILIKRIMEGFPAEDVLKVGDVIVSVNGERVEKNPEFIKILGSNDNLSITFFREGKKLTKQVAKKDITKSYLAHNVGIVHQLCNSKAEEMKERRLCKKYLKKKYPKKMNE